MKESYTVTEQLLRDLEQLATVKMMPLERRLCDTAIWFHRNRGDVPREDLSKRLDFAEKTLDIFIELSAMLVERMQVLEGRGKSANLWIPRSS